jgi:Co/Zn/Cd efflux system component
VLADALSSVLAIAALLAAKYAGWVWMDPVMGIVGTVLVSRWSIDLLRDTSMVLLAGQGAEHMHAEIRVHRRRLRHAAPVFLLQRTAPKRHRA